ncbi:hypothetical protein ACQJBY_030714 [Aegilops geniculata]
MAPPGSRRWAYVRIMAGTIISGGLGFYVMLRIETSYKVRQLPSHQPAAICGPFGRSRGAYSRFSLSCAGEDGGEAASMPSWSASTMAGSWTARASASRSHRSHHSTLLSNQVHSWICTNA